MYEAMKSEHATGRGVTGTSHPKTKEKKNVFAFLFLTTKCTPHFVPVKIS